LILIEVVVPGSLAHQVEPAIEQCCAESGDRLLGRREYQEVNELFLVVQLLQDAHQSKHVPILGQALQNSMISSFNFVQGSLVAVSSPDILEQIHSFPLSLGDSWVPSARDPNCIYLCLHRPLLTHAQAAWFLLHEETTWNYV